MSILRLTEPGVTLFSPLLLEPPGDPPSGAGWPWKYPQLVPFFGMRALRGWTLKGYLPGPVSHGSCHALAELSHLSVMILPSYSAPTANSWSKIMRSPLAGKRLLFLGVHIS